MPVCFRSLLFAVVVGLLLPVAPVAAQDASEGLGGFSKIDGSRLKPVTLAYDITVTAQGKTLNLSLSQTIKATSTGNADTWTVVGHTQMPGATVMDSLVMTRSTLHPLSRHLRGPTTLDVDYTDSSVSGEMTLRDQSQSIETSFKGPTLAGGAHNLIALGTMPLAPDFSATLRVFAPREQEVRAARYNVTDTSTVETAAGSFETYVVDINVGDAVVTGTMHLRKEAPHYVIKSETERSTPKGTRTVTQTLSSVARPSGSDSR